jgi:hypothetical protein
MSWSIKLKEKAQEHTVSGLLGLIVLLSLIIWAAVPSELWNRISEAVPKRVLWALIGLEAIAICLSSAYIMTMRRELRSKMFWMCGVLWDKKHTPHCPSCSKPLGGYTQNLIHGSWEWGFKCIDCNQPVSLSDESGCNIELSEVKRLLSSKSAI